MTENLDTWALRAEDILVKCFDDGTVYLLGDWPEVIGLSGELVIKSPYICRVGQDIVITLGETQAHYWVRAEDTMMDVLYAERAGIFLDDPGRATSPGDAVEAG